MTPPKIVIISLLLLVSITAQSGNTWVISESVDPMTDKTIRTAVQTVVPVTTTGSKEVSLVLRCTLKKKSRGGYKGKLEIYFNWDEVVNVEHLGNLTYVYVQIRFDDKKMDSANWAPSNSFQTTFVKDIHSPFNVSGEQKAFLKKMRKANQLIVRTIAAFDNAITATFNLSGLEQEAASVLEFCG